MYCFIEEMLIQNNSQLISLSLNNLKNHTFSRVTKLSNVAESEGQIFRRNIKGSIL
jgi:hypothetical protein